MRRVSGSSTSNSDGLTDRSAYGGWALAVLSCLLMVGGGLGWVWTQRSSLAWQALGNQSMIRHGVVTERINEWIRQRQRGGLGGVVFGDSVLARPPQKPIFTPTVGAALATAGINADVLDLTYLGLDAFQFYYTLRPALAGRPRFAIVEINLRTFAADWMAAGGLHNLHLSAGLSMRQALRAHEALATKGLSLLAPLAYRLERATGMLFLFDGLRLRYRRALEGIGTQVNTLLGLHALSRREEFTRFLPRLDARVVQAWYGLNFESTASAEVLCALRDELLIAGVMVQFVVAPINITAVGALGIDTEDLARRIARLREAIGAQPDEWIEVSDLFSPGDFMDAVHLKVDGVERLASVVGNQLAHRLSGKPLTLDYP